ncbi:MAG: hypothetical protein KDA89_15390, partial [Planctomycetaceae bacterium]|nr:hypothetical protein [Planctomycetaceae bacterium]
MSVKYGLSVRFTTYIPAMVTVLLLTGNAFGQLYPYYTFPWAAYDPAVSITSRVRAQAELIRAQGDAAARFAEAAEMHASARLINADAYSAELDNWLKELRTRWNRRIANEEKKLEFNHVRQIAKLRYLNDQKWTNSRTWDRLKNHPEMAEGSAIKHGAALNFLLDRLSVAGALPYGEINPQAGPYGPDALTQLRIEPELLQHIVLEQDGTTFTAADFSNSSVTYWPFYLLWDDFESSRLEYEAARAVVVKECTEAGAATVDSIKNLQYALGLLTRDFMASVEVRRWAMENKGLTKWNKTRTFLAE